MRELISAEIEQIKPYSPQSFGEKFVLNFADRGGLINLAANECPYGTSSKVKEALVANSINQVNRYSISNQEDLRKDIGDFYNLEPNWIHLGAGIEEILTHLSRAFLVEDDVVVLSECTFPLYYVNNALQRASQYQIPIKNLGYDLEAFIKKLKQLKSPPRMIYLCNPNNPTGTVFGIKEFEALVSSIPKESLVVLDEAYYEYVQTEDYPDGRNYLETIPRLIVTRTFSKAYGLAGLRIGYSMQSPEITDVLQKFKPLHSINNIAEICAREALRDQVHLKNVIRSCNEEKEFLVNKLKEMRLAGLEPHRTQANFILISIPVDSSEVARRLLTDFGIIVAPLDGFGLCGKLRVSPGTREQNILLLNALTEILGGKTSD